MLVFCGSCLVVSIYPDCQLNWVTRGHAYSLVVMSMLTVNKLQHVAQVFAVMEYWEWNTSTRCVETML